MDAYLNMTESTINSVKRLQEAYQKKLAESGADQIPFEEYVALKNKFMSNTKIKWIKHVYNINSSSTTNDHRYEFLNMENPVVIPVILDRLQKLYDSWSSTRRDRQKKWKKQCKNNYEKALDNRSFNFKISEKKEMVPKTMLKDAKDRHLQQLTGKLELHDLMNFYTTFKP
jgi:histone deacetylase complex regulatory component SIN3